MIKTTLRIGFDFAHRLMNHKGKCRNIHGHSGVAEITFRGEDRDQDSGFLGNADLADLKEMIKGWIDENWDHGLLLNADDPLHTLLAELHYKESKCELKIYIALSEPSSEYMAEHLHHKVHERCLAMFPETYAKTFWIERVKIYETQSNAAEYTALEW